MVGTDEAVMAAYAHVFARQFDCDNGNARLTRSRVEPSLLGATPPSSVALANRDGDVETARDE